MRAHRKEAKPGWRKAALLRRMEKLGTAISYKSMALTAVSAQKSRWYSGFKERVNLPEGDDDRGVIAGLLVFARRAVNHAGCGGGFDRIADQNVVNAHAAVFLET